MKALPRSDVRAPQDFDARILMAAALSSKRRQATLADIVAAAEMVLGFVPFAEKLGAAIERLSVRGLIGQLEGGLVLTDAGLDMMSKQPRKASQEDIVAAVRNCLAEWRPRAGHPPVQLDIVELGTAIRAHKATRKTGKNLLMPKPEVTRHFKAEGRWRRATKTR